MRRLLCLLIILLLWPHPVAAQTNLPQWLERKTTYISILYPQGSEAEAERYAGYSDAIYDEVTAVVGYRPAPPLTLRIYPTKELYQQVNPAARWLEGIVAHAHTGRREISIAVQQTVGMSDEELRNNVRHELMHIIAAELSDGRLSTMWQEGIAQYVEVPTSQSGYKIALLKQALENNDLATWRLLDSAGAVYDNPALGYPQSWSMVSFLIQRYGMARFLAFLEALRTASGYRSALSQAYSLSAESLESEWLAQLPTWIDGGWKQAPSVAFDQASIETALAAGRYSEALTAAETALTIKDDPAIAALREQARKGVQAEDAAAAARVALLEGRYAEAKTAIEQALPLFADLARIDRQKLLNDYLQRADQGLKAQQLLETARRDLNGIRIVAARNNIEQAANLFSQLGDSNGRSQAAQLLESLNLRLKIVGIGLIVVVGLGLAWNIDRRRAMRKRMLPL